NHYHAIAAGEAERGERVAGAVRRLAQGVVAQRPARAAQRRAVAVAARQIVEQDRARVVARRHREPDLACAGAIIRDLVRDRSHAAILPLPGARARSAPRSAATGAAAG